MIKSLFKVLTIPFVYVILVIQFVLKYILLAPILLIFYALKNLVIGAVIGVIAGFFLSPIATVIIIALFFIGSIASSFEDMQDGFWGMWDINWNYASDVFSKNKQDKLLRKRKKYIKLANKEYKKARDEFWGFDSIADIYAK
jgi:hypothetical protein